MKDLINFEMELNQGFYEANSVPQTIYGLLRLKPADNMISGRMPLDISFLLDKSYSMDEDVGRVRTISQTMVDLFLGTILTKKKKNSLVTKLDVLKMAVNQLIDQLEKGDRITVIAFDSVATEIVSKVIKKDGDKKDVKDKVNKITTGSATNLSKSLKMAVNSSSLTDDKVKRVIIFTDGEVNTPSAKAEEKSCRELAKKAGKEKLPFILFGTGITYNDKFLGELAEITGGRMEHVSDPAGVIDIFKEEIETLGDIAITGMEANINTAKGITLREVSKVIPQISPVNLSSPDYVFMSLGDLDRARGQAILFQAEIPPLKEGKHEIGTLEVIFDIPLKNIRGKRAEFKLEINCVADKNLCQVNRSVLSTVQLAGASKLQTLALERADSGDTLSAAKMMNQVQNIYTNLGQKDLATEAKTLTNAIAGGSMSGTTQDIRRSLTTKARQTVRRTLTST